MKIANKMRLTKRMKNNLKGLQSLLDSQANEKSWGNEKKIDLLEKILQGKNTVALGGHVRPDGDCVGSCVGLFLYIRKNFPKIDVDVYLEPIPPAFSLIVGTDQIKSQKELSFVYGDLLEEETSQSLDALNDSVKRYDLFITLDCAGKDRLGFSTPFFNRAQSTFCIDHHISNEGFADLNYIVPEASSTSELVYSILNDDRMDKEIAEALFMGIIHDTGVFRYDNASSTTLKVVANLLEKGVKNDEIIEKTFYERTFPQTKIIGKALLKSELILDEQCILCVVTKDEMSRYNVTSMDLDGIVSQLWLVKDIHVAIFMYELETGDFKVSLRSSDKVDVSEIAKKFGGGGHKKAAGFEMKGPSEKIVECVSSEISEILRRSNVKWNC